MSKFLNYIKLVVVLLMTVQLAACGGGSASSPDLTPVNPGSSSTGKIEIANSKIILGKSTTVAVTFLKPDGTPAKDVPVAFTTTIGSVKPAVVVTDANGQAQTTLSTLATASKASVSNSLGAGKVTATAKIDGKDYVKVINFEVTLPPLKLSEIKFGVDTVSFGGTTSVSVTVLDELGRKYTDAAVEVEFTAQNAEAITEAKVKTVNGVATTTYKAVADGTDTVTASIRGAASMSKTITIKPLNAGSITFVSAEPTSLGIKGMGGVDKSEVSILTFKVVDTAGRVRPDTTVNFQLNTTVGGIQLSSSSGVTDQDGLVKVQVMSGTIATPVRVQATIKDTNISTQSEQLVISTGLPAQDGFSVSIETLNVEGFNYDGVTSLVTARLSDHFRNPVSDGTAVYFTTSGGSIGGSCTTINGACSVTWTSQNPRPANGRAMILAYAIGEESFIDKNGNGLADPGEFTDDSEAFRDDNENGVLDGNETFIDFNGNKRFDGPDGKYNGVLQGSKYVGAPTSKHVFSNTALVMATSDALVTSTPNPFAVALNSTATLTIAVSDLNGNAMPAGTKVDFELITTVKGLTGTTATVLSMVDMESYTFPNTSAKGAATFSAIITDPSVNTSAKGQLKVKVTSPKGTRTDKIIPIN